MPEPIKQVKTMKLDKIFEVTVTATGEKKEYVSIEHHQYAMGKLRQELEDAKGLNKSFSNENSMLRNELKAKQLEDAKQVQQVKAIQNARKKENNL